MFTSRATGFWPIASHSHIQYPTVVGFTTWMWLHHVFQPRHWWQVDTHPLHSRRCRWNFRPRTPGRTSVEVTRWPGDTKRGATWNPSKNDGFTMKNSVTYYEKLCFLPWKIVVLPWNMVVLPWKMVVLQWKTVVLLTIYIIIYICLNRKMMV
jgi:hypothetical protein